MQFFPWRDAKSKTFTSSEFSVFFLVHKTSSVKSFWGVSTFFFLPCFFQLCWHHQNQTLEIRIESTLFESHPMNIMLQKHIDLHRMSDFNESLSERSHASICEISQKKNEVINFFFSVFPVLFWLHAFLSLARCELIFFHFLGVVKIFLGS